MQILSPNYTIQAIRIEYPSSRKSLNISITLAIFIDFLSLRNPIQLFLGGENMINIRDRLQRLMDERGLNMYSLAKRSGLSWNTIKNIFSRSTNPTVTTLSMLCDGLGITLAQFFDEGDGSGFLTAEQQHLINRWDQLSDREKKTVNSVVDTILDQRK